MTKLAVTVLAHSYHENRYTWSFPKGAVGKHCGASCNGFFIPRRQGASVNGPAWAAPNKHRHTLHPRNVRAELVAVSAQLSDRGTQDKQTTKRSNHSGGTGLETDGSELF